MRTSLHIRSLIARRGGAIAGFPSIEQLEPRALLTTVFGPAPAVTTGPQISSQVVADFDGDGVNDIAALEVGSGKSILFFKGRGDGSFDAPLRTTLRVRVSAIGAGQWTPGGGFELVALGGAGDPIDPDPNGTGYRATFVRVLRFDSGTGKLKVMASGTVAAPAGGDDRPSAPIIGDFTGDGLPDIAFAPSDADGRIVVMERSGSGLRLAATFTLPTPAGRAGSLPADPIGADLNGDGRLDIVSFTSAGYVALMNSSSGLSATPTPLALSTALDWKFADVDGDGRADAVSLWIPPDQRSSTSAGRYAEVLIRKGLGAGAFGATQTIGRVMTGAGPAAGSQGAADHEWLLVGQDIDHDGLGDIVYIHDYDALDGSVHSVRERVVVITHGVDGAWNIPNFALGPNERTGSAGDSIEVLGGRNEIVVDLNGDGRADLLDFGSGPIRGYLSSEVVSLALNDPAKDETSARSTPIVGVLSNDQVVLESQRRVFATGAWVADTEGDSAAGERIPAPPAQGPSIPGSFVRASGDGAASAEVVISGGTVVRGAAHGARGHAPQVGRPWRAVEHRDEQTVAAGDLGNRLVDGLNPGDLAGQPELGPMPLQQGSQNRAEGAAALAASGASPGARNAGLPGIADRPIAANSGEDLPTDSILKRIASLGMFRTRRLPRRPMQKPPEHPAISPVPRRAASLPARAGDRINTRAAKDFGSPIPDRSPSEDFGESAELETACVPAGA